MQTITQLWWHDIVHITNKKVLEYSGKNKKKILYIHWYIKIHLYRVFSSIYLQDKKTKKNHFKFLINSKIS
jgi:hypothetical protein